ncbi:MAG: cyclodeaminase/cyclohydrolase family protein [Clostridium sp.]
MADLKNLTVTEFVNVTASDAPAPGGGSVAALAGALAAALAEMVANLTVGKEKYAAVEDEMKKLADDGAALRVELLEDIQKDSTSFNLYMDAIGMPKSTDEEKAARREAMQNGLKAAAQVPLSVGAAAYKIFPIAEAVVARGNTNAVTDGLVAAMMARTAVIGALFNVKINLGSIKDEAFVAELAAEVKELEEKAIAYEQKILKASDLSDKLY